MINIDWFSRSVNRQKKKHFIEFVAVVVVVVIVIVAVVGGGDDDGGDGGGSGGGVAAAVLHIQERLYTSSKHLWISLSAIVAIQARFEFYLTPRL